MFPSYIKQFSGKTCSPPPGLRQIAGLVLYQLSYRVRQVFTAYVVPYSERVATSP